MHLNTYSIHILCIQFISRKSLNQRLPRACIIHLVHISFTWIWNMIPYHFYVSLFLLSETETWYRNTWNISDRCFRSKYKTETDPEISFILPRCQCWWYTSQKWVENAGETHWNCNLEQPILHSCYISWHPLVCSLPVVINTVELEMV